VWPPAPDAVPASQPQAARLAGLRASGPVWAETVAASRVSLVADARPVLRVERGARVAAGRDSSAQAAQA